MAKCSRFNQELGNRPAHPLIIADEVGSPPCSCRCHAVHGLSTARAGRHQGQQGLSGACLQAVQVVEAPAGPDVAAEADAVVQHPQQVVPGGGHILGGPPGLRQRHLQARDRPGSADAFQRVRLCPISKSNPAWCLPSFLTGLRPCRSAAGTGGNSAQR